MGKLFKREIKDFIKDDPRQENLRRLFLFSLLKTLFYKCLFRIQVDKYELGSGLLGPAFCRAHNDDSLPFTYKLLPTKDLGNQNVSPYFFSLMELATGTNLF